MYLRIRIKALCSSIKHRLRKMSTTTHARLVRALHKVMHDEKYRCVGVGDKATQAGSGSTADASASLSVCVYTYIYKVGLLVVYLHAWI